MCGIAGIVGAPEGEGRAILQPMLAALAHRGPDAVGVAAGDGWAIGARRLAVVDLVTGDQPVANESGTVHVVQNGEIYNYRELHRDLERAGHHLRSRGDTEVLAHLWEDLGVEMLAHLRGMFALAVVDERSRTLLLARDRVGKKPLYWWRRGSRLLFASELKALWAGVGGRPELDEAALDAYLGWGFVPEGQCLARNVCKLPPAHALRCSLEDSSQRLLRYWQLSVQPERAVRFGEAVEEVRATLAEAVRLRTRADVPVAVFLSGGLDSGSVAALAAGTVMGPALCVRFAGMKSETRLARRTARRWSLRFQEVTVTPADGIDLLPSLAEIYDEPLADPSVIPTVLIARAARPYAKVVLNGDGGDEVLGGYRRLLLAGVKAALGAGAGVARGVLTPLAALLPARFHRVQEALGEAILYDAVGPAKLSRREIQQLRGSPPLRPPALEELLAASAGHDEPTRLRLLDLGFFLPGDLLPKMDRATMAVSLEARSPFLDHVLLERTSRYPTSVLLRGGTTKAVLRAAASPWLPRSVRRGRKRGFEIPLVAWLCGSWAPVVEEVLADPAARLRQLLDARALEAWRDWWRRPDRVRAARSVFTLVTLEYWLRRWT